MMRKKIDLPILLINVLGILLLVYCGWMLVSGNTAVRDPDAMLPMSEKEAAGILLTFGTVPLFTANLGAFLYLWKDSVFGWKRVLFFLPALISLLLSIHFWVFAG